MDEVVECLQVFRSRQQSRIGPSFNPKFGGVTEIQASVVMPMHLIVTLVTSSDKTDSGY